MDDEPGTSTGTAPDTPVGRARRIGALAVVAGCLQLVALPLRYENLRVSLPAGTHLPAGDHTSFSLWGLLGAERAVAILTALAVVLLGFGCARRRSIGATALVAGFSVPFVAGATTTILALARNAAPVHLGPGFDVQLAATMMGAVVAVGALVVVSVRAVPPSADRRAPAGLVVLASALVGATPLFVSLAFPRGRLSDYPPLTVWSVLAALVAVAALAATPWVAWRAGPAIGARLLAALALSEALAVAGALASRAFDHGPLQLTVGFWLQLTAVAVLVVAAAVCRTAAPASGTVPSLVPPE